MLNWEGMTEVPLFTQKQSQLVYMKLVNCIVNQRIIYLTVSAEKNGVW